MPAPSFDDLYLLPAERRLLKQLQRHGRVVVSTADQDAYRKLNGYGLVFKPYDSVSDGLGSSSRQYHPECLLTDKGERYLASLGEKKKAISKQSLRYWITTGISFLALVKSFWPEITEAVAWLYQLLLKQP